MSSYKKKEQKLKEYRRFSLGITLGGFCFFIMGILRFFFTEPKVGINLKYHQPIMIDCSLFLILGIVASIVGVYRIFNEKKIFEEEISLEMKERKKRN